MVKQKCSLVIHGPHIPNTNTKCDLEVETVAQPLAQQPAKDSYKIG